MESKSQDCRLSLQQSKMLETTGAKYLYMMRMVQNFMIHYPARGQNFSLLGTTGAFLHVHMCFFLKQSHKCAEGISALSDSTSCPSSDPNLEVSPSPGWSLYSNVPITKNTVLTVPLYSHSPLVTPTANGTNLANLASEPPIPAWGYGIIAAGVVIAACSILAVILVALYCRKRIMQSLPTSTMHQGITLPPP